MTDFELASTVRGTNSVTQENRHTAEWIAPEILEGTDTITREADVFAFGMVVMEVGRALSLLVLGWMVRPTSERRLRFLQGLVRRKHKN